MKKIVFILLLLPLWYACTQESLMEEGEKTKTEKVVVRFKINQAPINVVNINNGVTTRAIQASDVVADKVLDIWVVQFDDAGNFMQKSYFKNIDITAFDVPLTPHPTGTGGNIYFLANIGTQLDYPENESTFKNQMKKFSNLDDQLITGDDGKKYVPMYGDIYANVSPNGRLTTYPSIFLKKMVSQVNFTYTIKDNPCAKFVPEVINVCNVSDGINFVEKGTGVFNISTFYALKNYTLTTTPSLGETLTFFVPENHQGTSIITSSDERNKAYRDNATHIEMKGHTVGSMGGEAVTFRYYLGRNNSDDYNVVRGTQYNISLSIDATSQGDMRFVIPERSNCYLMKPNTTIEIPVLRANDSDLGIQIPDVTTGWTASLYWCTVTTGLVTVTPYVSKGYFTVTAGANQGNALVVVKNTAGDILWSWHIWVDDEDMNSTSYQETYLGFTWMNRNLGAILGAGNYFETFSPLFYQWGRKDPYIGSQKISAPYTVYSLYNSAGTAFVPPTYGSITTTPFTEDPYSAFANINDVTIGQENALKVSVRYPTLFLGSWRGSTARNVVDPYDGCDSWGGEYNQPKSLYDPCPAGWRVVSYKKNSTGVSYVYPVNIYSSQSATVSSSNYFVMTSSGGSYPCSGYRSGSTATLMNSVGALACGWTATVGEFNTNGSAHDLWTNYNGSVTTISQADRTGKAAAQPIRCVKNWN